MVNLLKSQPSIVSSSNGVRDAAPTGSKFGTFYPYRTAMLKNRPSVGNKRHFWLFSASLTPVLFLISEHSFWPFWLHVRILEEARDFRNDVLTRVVLTRQQQRCDRRADRSTFWPQNKACIKSYAETFLSALISELFLFFLNLKLLWLRLICSLFRNFFLFSDTVPINAVSFDHSPFLYVID